MEHQRQKKADRPDGTAFTTLKKAPNSVRKFSIGQVLYVRIYFTEKPNEYKIRPAVFVGSTDSRTAIMRAAYSTGAHAGSKKITLNNRTCYISDHPVTVDKTDIVGTSNIIIKPL